MQDTWPVSLKKVQELIKSVKDWTIELLNDKCNINLGSYLKQKVVGTDANGNIAATTINTAVLSTLDQMYTNNTQDKYTYKICGTGGDGLVTTTSIGADELTKIVSIFKGDDTDTSAGDDPYDYGWRFMNGMLDGAISSCWSSNFPADRILATNAYGKIDATQITYHNLDKINHLQNVHQDVAQWIGSKADSVTVNGHIADFSAHLVDPQAHDARFNAIEADYEAQIETEKTRAGSAETGIETRSLSRYNSACDKISTEQIRATFVESTLDDKITAEATARESADNTLDSKISAEQTRAKTVEKDLSDSITSHASNEDLHYSGLPIGTVIWWSGSAAERPAGFLLLDGSTYDITLYPELYAILKTNVLPNYIGRFIKGSSIPNKYEAAGLPNITGHIPGEADYTASAVEYWKSVSGAFYKDTTTTSDTCGNAEADNDNYRIGFNASLSNPIYGKSTTVTPENISAVPLIKAKHYACVYEPGSLDETVRTEFNNHKDSQDIHVSRAELGSLFVGFPDYANRTKIAPPSGSSSSTFEYGAIESGWLSVSVYWSGDHYGVLVSGIKKADGTYTDVMIDGSCGGQDYTQDTFFIPCEAGRTYRFIAKTLDATYTDTELMSASLRGGVRAAYFIPFKKLT